MEAEKVYAMPFAKVYAALVNKAVRKNRTQEEVDRVIEWLTGYDAQQIAAMAASDKQYGDFFREAPCMNPDRKLIRGAVCGIRVEEIGDPLMRDIRSLDKLIDELAKGKPLPRILRAEQ